MMTTSGGECTSSEMSDTTAYYDAITTEYNAACSNDLCTNACLDVLNQLFLELPDCVYSDGTNQYQIVEQTIATCASTTTATADIGSNSAGTTDSNSNSAGTTDNSGSTSTLRTSSPAASSDSAKSDKNVATATGMSAVSAVAAISVAILAQIVA